MSVYVIRSEISLSFPRIANCAGLMAPLRSDGIIIAVVLVFACSIARILWLVYKYLVTFYAIDWSQLTLLAKSADEVPLSLTSSPARTVNSFIYQEVLPEIYNSKTTLALYFIRKLLSRHILYDTFAPRFKNGENVFLLNRIKSSVLLLGQFLTYSAVAMFYVHFLIQDNKKVLDKCSRQVTKDTCLSGLNNSTGGISYWFLTCQWDINANKCIYTLDQAEQAQLALITLSLSFLTTVTSTALLLIIGFLVDSLYFHAAYFSKYGNIQLSYSLHYQKRATRFAKIYQEANVKSLEYIEKGLREYTDDFQVLQSKKVTMLRAARLLLLQKHIDYVPITMELSNLLKSPRSIPWTQVPEAFDGTIHWLNALKSWYKTQQFYIYSVGNPTAAYKLLNHARFRHPQLVHHRIRCARQKAIRIRRVLMQYSKETHRQDLILFKYFMVEWFSGCDQAIVFQLLLEDDVQIVEYLKYSVWFRLFSAIAVIAAYVGLLVGSLYGSLLLNYSSETGYLYVVLTAVSLAIYNGFIVPSRVFLADITLPALVKADFLRLFNVVAVRVPRIFVRPSGYLSQIHSFLQHFNPACRAARYLPHLPIARLLISLHDFDLPRTLREAWRPPYDVAMPCTDSPLIRDCIDVLNSNVYVVCRYGFFRAVHYGKLLLKGLIHWSLLRLSREVRFASLDVIVSTFLHAAAIALVHYWSSLQGSAIAAGVLIAAAAGVVFLAVVSYSCGIETNCSGRREVLKLREDAPSTDQPPKFILGTSSSSPRAVDAG